MKNLASILILSIFLISGCSEKEYTVDYLVQNTDVLNKILEECKSNKQKDNNCKNANEAQAIIFNKTGGKKRQQW